MWRWAFHSEFLWLVMIPRLKRTRQVRTNRSSVSNRVWHRFPRAISHLDILCSLKFSGTFGVDIVTDWGVNSSSPPFSGLWKPRITGRKTVFPSEEFLHFFWTWNKRGEKNSANGHGLASHSSRLKNWSLLNSGCLFLTRHINHIL